MNVQELSYCHTSHCRKDSLAYIFVAETATDNLATLSALASKQLESETLCSVSFYMDFIKLLLVDAWSI